MTFEQVYAQCKLVVEISETEKKRLESQENLCAYEICRISDLEKDIEFYSKIAEACEKQIAKKPVNDGHCPECFSDNECPYNEEKVRYCPSCGQKIDWGNDE